MKAATKPYFFNAPLEFLLIGGLLSLVTGVAILAKGGTGLFSFDAVSLPIFILLFNSAHFAASTVRLYSKKNALQEFPRLTMVFPLVVLALTTLAVALPKGLGSHLQALYLTWSPFHYAAQAYGLGLIYSYRSGVQLSTTEKRVFYAVCMLPFLRAFLGAPNSGLGWFVDRDLIYQSPLISKSLSLFTSGITLAIFAVPVLLILYRFMQNKAMLPSISWIIVFTNGVWWVLFDYIDAFVWATIFHGIQYMVIVVIYHVRDKLREPDNHRSIGYHVLWFYGISLLLGYLLFYCWPGFYMLLGFGMAESMLVTIAMINIHHFIVDAFIWRSRKPAPA